MLRMQKNINFIEKAPCQMGKGNDMKDNFQRTVGHAAHTGNRGIDGEKRHNSLYQQQ